MVHSTIRSWALVAILAVGGSSGSAAAGVGDSLRKKADEARAKLKEGKGQLKDAGKKAGAFAGSLGGLADKMEKKCLRDRSGKVPMTPSAAPGAVACRAGLKCPNDVTEKLVVVGEPLHQVYPKGDLRFARNVWDLHVWDGKLYIGNGNSNNKGPAPNAGPVGIWSYDPKTSKFAREWTAPDEQIAHFRAVGGKLVVPGHDPKGSWIRGNFYRLEGRGWTALRTLPRAIHNYDLIGHRGEMFAALGTPTGGVVARSKDAGRSWTSHFAVGSFRVYTLFELGGRLHGSANNGKFFVYDGSRRLKPVTNREFFPGEKVNRGRLRVVRPEVLGSQTVYLGACAALDHDWIPVGLFAAGASGNARLLPLPGGARPRDLLVRDGTLHVLASTDDGGRGTIVHVFTSRDLQEWTEALRFRADTFARSFEILGGDYYFGLGSEADRLTDSTGRILRVPASAL